MNEVNCPRISIITPSFNQARYIEETIKSVERQNYGNIEHIVMDGGSTDGTVEILRKYPHLIWFAESDHGQADALNKGLNKATGDIIGWINSDDFYERDIFPSVARCFDDPSVLWVVGNLTYVFEESGDAIPGRSPVVTSEALIKNPDIVRQQPAFFRKALLETVGAWNPEFHMIMDYDLWIRLAKVSAPKMVDRNWAYFRCHALQKSTYVNLKRQLNEIGRVLARERVPRGAVRKIRSKKQWYWIKSRIKHALIEAGALDDKYRARPLRVDVGAKE